ncbi:MAG: glyceraldehyde 3-phosphate dehydrogenase NAD-binding domain-containing protein [Candidatus Woesearchaeota archaeon]
MVRIGINGLGVMGRYLIRAIEIERQSGKFFDQEHDGVKYNRQVEVVAFNDLFPASQIVPYLKHDSVYGPFTGSVELDGDDIIINGARMLGSSEKDPAKLNWKDKGVDVVYDATGVFASKPGVENHLEAGAKKVIISAPSDFAQKTFVMGVNDDTYKGEDIVSNASCTTNCLAPLARALYDSFGFSNGLMTTIHAYTADQNLVDGPHKSVARGYSAALNWVPTTTGAAKAIGKVIDELDKRLNGICIRGPIPVGSLVDLVVLLDKDADKDAVNDALRGHANGDLSGVLEYENGPIVSSMVLRNPVPCIFDASQTIVNGPLVKTMAYYDNVSGYSHQAVKMIKMIMK